MNDTFPVIDGHTKLTGLLGSPVSHSISPLMHNEAFRLLDLNYVYLCFDVPEANLADTVKGLRCMNIAGFNCTMLTRLSIKTADWSVTTPTASAICRQSKRPDTTSSAKK